MTRTTTAGHGTRARYAAGCRCPDCAEASAAYYRAYRASGPTIRGPITPRIPRTRQVLEIPCVVCHDPIVGFPDGWMHTSTRRQFAEDGHEAQPRTIA